MIEVANDIKGLIDKTGWSRVRFGDVVKEVRETVRNPEEEGIDRIVGLEHIESEAIKVKSWGNLEDGKSFSRRFRKGQMLFGRRRAYLKKAALAEFDGICSGDIIVMEAIEEKLISELLPFLIQNDHFFDFAVKHSAGSLSPRTKFKSLAEYEFLLPPKDQQAQLAELLWAMDEVVERGINLYRGITDLKRSTLKELLTGDKSAEFFELGYLGSYYPIVKLGDFATVKGRIGWRGLKKSEYVDEGPYLIANKHINDGRIEWNKCDKISEFRYEESKEIALKKGDVIFSKDGAIGNPAHIGSLPRKATINSTMMLLRPKSDLDSEYLYQILLSAYFERLKIRCLSGSAIPHIFQGDMKSFEFPLPDKNKQIEIRDILRKLDESKIKCERQINVSRNLQKSLINQIF